MTNVQRGKRPVKGDTDWAASSTSGRAGATGRQVVEISRLLVEVLQLGHVGRTGAADQPDHEAATVPVADARGDALGESRSGPLATQVIRAAIFVYEHGPQTIGQLASGIGISQGWASRVVDELERAGYLERRRDPADRRVVRVSLVPAAVERVERVYRWRGDAVEAALDGLSAEERSVVESFLQRFVEAASTGS